MMISKQINKLDGIHSFFFLVAEAGLLKTALNILEILTESYCHTISLTYSPVSISL